MNKADSAIDSFKNGFSCAQAVFTAFSEDFGLDRKSAAKIACSFGAGMGYQAQTCGAVTGAFLVLGLKCGQDTEEDKQAKALNYLYVKEFADRFKKLNGSICCKELIEYDISDEKQLIAARQSGVFATKCAKYVGDAVKILEEMLAEPG